MTTVSRAALAALLCLLAPAASAKAVYWSLFNEEGDTDSFAAWATYDTMADMMADQNRTGEPVIKTPASRNIVGTGAYFIPGDDVAGIPPAAVALPAGLPLLLGALGLTRGLRRRG